MERLDKDSYYLGIAVAVSKRSTCLKRHYGCVIVKDDIIEAIYNEDSYTNGFISPSWIN